MEEREKKVVLCVPTLTGPHPATQKALKQAARELKSAGWKQGFELELGCPYISAARMKLLRKALDANATQIIFIDHDVSWKPGTITQILETPGDVVGCTYRFKKAEEEFMGYPMPDESGRPQVRDDGCIKMMTIPAGFLRVSLEAVNRLMRTYPELVCGEPWHPDFDLFNHGVHKGVWWGEDYAFCRRWIDAGGDVWCRPDLAITHHLDKKAFKGTYDMYLRRQPGGDLSDNPAPPT